MDAWLVRNLFSSSATTILQCAQQNAHRRAAQLLALHPYLIDSVNATQVHAGLASLASTSARGRRPVGQSSSSASRLAVALLASLWNVMQKPLSREAPEMALQWPVCVSLNS